MGYARLQQEAGGATVARQVYQEAIETVPDIVALRVALAELEEAEGNNDAAKAALQAAFDKLPSAFTFATLQRFVRRKETIAAARKIFSDTLLLRRDPANETLGLELCLAHAQLELDVNCCPQVALKTLELGMRFLVASFVSLSFSHINTPFIIPVVAHISCISIITISTTNLHECATRHAICASQHPSTHFAR